MTGTVGIGGIGQIAIAITDVERSVEFYQHTLGLTLLFQAPPGLAFFDCGGVRLMLTTPQGEARDHRTSVIYYKVDDIQMATASLKQKGVEFVREPQMAAKLDDHELWIGFLRDPDENLVGIMSEVPLSDAGQN